jgi:starch synthase
MPAEKPLRICLAASEMAPLAKTGGLADVTAALIAYLDRRGHDVRLLMPFYGSIEEGVLEIEVVPELQDLSMELDGRSIGYWIVRARQDAHSPSFYLLQCPELFGGPSLYGGDDEHIRFVLLTRAAIEMCQRLEFQPDLFHCHDWHTALLPVYLKTAYAWDDLFRHTRTVLTIHNIGYQGVFGNDVLGAIGLEYSTDFLDADDLYHGRINFLKAGVMHADLLTTVSPTYAKEILGPEYGMGLEQQLRARHGSLVGILNGVDYDEWNPETDPLIPYTYSASDLEGKEKNKRAVLEEMGLQYRFDRPLFGMVSRLTYQKGIELVEQVMPELLRQHDFSLLVLGNGESQYEQFFAWLQGEFTEQVAFHPGFNNPLAHRIEAGSDVFVMPSRYEPCGLNQMYSLKYGTVPLVRATGGLADSVQHFDPDSGTGTGIVFHDFDANGLTWGMKTALKLYANKHAWKQVVYNGMQKDYSWAEQGRLYEERFRKLVRE